MPRHRRRSSLLLSIIPTVAVVGSLLAPSAAIAAPATPIAATAIGSADKKHPTPKVTMAESAKRQLEAEKALGEAKKGDDSYTDGRYIVTLRGNPAASYTGGVKSFARTQPKAGDQFDASSKKVANYSKHLASTQSDVAGDVGAKILQQYTIATNGFSSTLTAEQARKLAQDPRVESVSKTKMLHIQADPEIDSGVHFLGLDGASGLWSTLGGFENAGKGIVIGSIDTGIAPENASFVGEPLTETAAGGEPTKKDGIISFTKANGKTFTSVCTPGDNPAVDQFTGDECNSKVIGAHYYATGFGPTNVAKPSAGEYLSPRDGNGHGSHTASTAAGNHGVPAAVGGKSFGDISGVAPAAKISAYKVCWTSSTGNPEDDACSEDDSLSAIDQAIKDGVDVINYSIGGGAANSTVSTVDMAFLNAAVAGVFVAAAAGNAGPKESTLDNAAPWITTVAASTINPPEATATLGNGNKLLGVSITVPSTGISGALVAARATGAAKVSEPEFCEPKALDATKVTGKIVLCERGGGIGRVDKSKEVKRAGGIGMILVNAETESLDPDLHAVPTVHVDVNTLGVIRAYAATPAATVTFSDGNPAGLPSAPTPQIAPFSSRGPVLADGGDLIKPDLAAPGVGILAATNNAKGGPGTYAFESGTSMATPHVAGLAAIYLAVHPGATPAEVKSALMTSSHDLVDAAGKPAEDVFAQGAGQVEPNKFLDPGLLYLNGKDDWERYIQTVSSAPSSENLDPSDLNLASIGIGALAGGQTVTRTVTSTRAGTFIADPVTIPGITTVLDHPSLTFSKAGETQTFTVTFTATDATLNVFATGYLRWTDGVSTVSSAIAVRPTAYSVPADVAGTGIAGSVEIPVTAGMTGPVGVATRGLSKGVVVRGSILADGAEVGQSYGFTMPEGVKFARFDLDADRDDVDLDLAVFSAFGNMNTLVYKGDSATDATDERVDVVPVTDTPSVVPGRWIAKVYGFKGTGPIDFTLTMYPITDEPAGNFSPQSDTIELVQGTTGQQRVSWSGLEAGSQYLGLVDFGTDGARTAVTVKTGGTAPAPASVPTTLTVAPDHVTPGQPRVEMSAPGLIPDSEYSLTFDSSSDVVVSGRADGTGSAIRHISIPDSIALGKHTATLQREGGQSVSTTFTVSDLILYEVHADPDQNFGDVPVIPLTGNFYGTGTLGFSMTSLDGKTSYLDQEPIAVKSDPDFPWVEGHVRSTAVGHPPFGEVKASMFVIEPDGSIGQTLTTTFVVERATSGLSEFFPVDGDPTQVEFRMEQHSSRSLLPTFVYKLCAGPMNFAEYDGTPGESHIVLDMKGVASVKVMLGSKQIARYTNRDPSRCADVAPVMPQQLWVQATTKSEDPAKPIQLTLTNVYPLRAGANFRVAAGNGIDAYGRGDLLNEGVSIDFVPTPPAPAPIIHTLDIPENQAVWTRAVFEQVAKDGAEAIRIRRALIAPVSVAMLAAIDPNAPIPADDPITPGDPGNQAGSGNGSGAAPAAGGPRAGLAATGVAIGLPIVAGAVFALLLGMAMVIRRRRTAAELIVDPNVDETV